MSLDDDRKLMEAYAEIERLRADLKGREAVCDSYANENQRFHDEIERLRAALKPFADAVYNDNGDMTITPCGIDEYAKAYFVMRRTVEQSAK